MFKFTLRNWRHQQMTSRPYALISRIFAAWIRAALQRRDLFIFQDFLTMFNTWRNHSFCMLETLFKSVPCKIFEHGFGKVLWRMVLLSLPPLSGTLYLSIHNSILSPKISPIAFRQSLKTHFFHLSYCKLFPPSLCSPPAGSECGCACMCQCMFACVVN
jgi:hypothetical protein